MSHGIPYTRDIDQCSLATGPASRAFGLRPSFGPPSSSCRLATAVDCRVLLRMADPPIARRHPLALRSPGLLTGNAEKGQGRQKNVENAGRAEPGRPPRLSNHAAKDGGNAAGRGLGVANRPLSGTTVGPLQLADPASSAAVRDGTLHCGSPRRSARRTEPERDAPSCITLVYTAGRQNGSGLLVSSDLAAFLLPLATSCHRLVSVPASTDDRGHHWAQREPRPSNLGRNRSYIDSPARVNPSAVRERASRPV